MFVNFREAQTRGRTACRSNGQADNILPPAEINDRQ